ncbi:MAG: LysR family transcriptional regulator, partial [Myxococcales bacterium]|nr:LysR family transcriptional regulator [Myxococcales bacterium]
PVRIVCHVGKADRLLADLITHQLDVVLSDSPVPPGMRVRAYNHLLGECGVTFLAAPALKRSLKGPFPRCLDDAPFLTPLPTTALGRSLDQWCEVQRVSPRIVARLADSALAKVFAQDGLGVFCLPTVSEEEAVQRYRLRVLGRTEEIKERFFAISPERKLKSPAVLALCEAARAQIFSA